MVDVTFSAFTFSAFNEHGEYPPALNSLVPTYITHLPEIPSGDQIGYERRDGGYVVRRIVDYNPTVREFLSRRHLDYDPDDVIIQTQGR